jgi:hypothetical protein
MGAIDIVQIVTGSIILAIGYFLKIIHSDIKENTHNVGENKGMINQLERDIEHERELRSQSYSNIMQILTEIKEDIKNIKK